MTSPTQPFLSHNYDHEKDESDVALDEDEPIRSSPRHGLLGLYCRPLIPHVAVFALYTVIYIFFIRATTRPVMIHCKLRIHAW